MATFGCTEDWSLVFILSGHVNHGASLIAQLVKNPSAMQETPVWFLGQEDPPERDRLPTPVFLGLPGGSAGKESAWNAEDPSLIPGSGRSPGEGISYPLQYSWAFLVAQVVPCKAGAWVWSWVGKIPWRREQLPTPVFLPREFQGQRSLSLVGYSPWGCKESDTTEWLTLSLFTRNYTWYLITTYNGI